MNRVHDIRLERDGIDGNIALLTDIDALNEAVRRHDAALLVIDPMMAHLADRMDAHRDHSIRRALAPLHQLAEATGCTPLVVGHLNKARSGDLFARVGGSIGLTAAARSVVLLTNDPEREDDPPRPPADPRQVQCGAARARVTPAYCRAPDRDDHATIATAAIEIGDEAPHMRVHHVLATPADGSKERAIDDARGWLEELLDSGPMPAEAVRAEAKAAGLSWRTVQRAKPNANVKSTRPGGRGPWQWTIHKNLGRQPAGAQDNGDLAPSVGATTTSGKPPDARPPTPAAGGLARDVPTKADVYDDGGPIVIPHETAAAESAVFNRPVTISAPRSRSAQAYRDVAADVIRRLGIEGRVAAAACERTRAVTFPGRSKNRTKLR